jgi:cyclophilin family peptidyl-prolyl cis-trans isomerase
VPKATKRERQRQNKEARRAAMQEAEKRRKRNRTIRNMVLLLLPVIVIFVILQLTNSDDSKDKKSSSANSSDIKRNYEKAPAQTIDPAASYTATMDTSEGTIVIALDAAQYPTSVNNFVFLAKNKFYDGLLVNRVAKDFVFQTGSPNNTTSGGPGYSVVGEVPSSTPAYPVGAVAFAKAGNEPAGTAGSQFFVVTGSSNLDLPADYAGIGTVTEGLDVAQKIGALAPTSGDGKPTKKVTIKKITIAETPASTTTAPATAAAP